MTKDDFPLMVAGARVRHVTLGPGKVTERNGAHATVKFDRGTPVTFNLAFTGHAFRKEKSHAD